MSELPWLSEEELAANVPPVDPAIEKWARALCLADGVKPDQIIGFPALPRWRSWVSLAELAIKAKSLVEAA